MAGTLMSSAGLVVGRTLTAGGYERLDLLTDGAGLLPLMRRPGAKKAGPQPDLFDLCEVRLEARAGGAWFLREYVLLRRFESLGPRYSALVAASEWARLVLANAPSVESTAFLYDVTLRALDAWERGIEPSAVRLKALYLFARDEGLPVREDWFAGLAETRKAVAASVINSPLDAFDSGGVDLATLDALATGLEKWMCGEHYIVPPRATK
jgi:hypothetical protein